MAWQKQIIRKLNRPGCMYKLTRLLNRWQNCWDLFKLLLCLGHFFRGIFRLGLGLIGFFQSTQSRYFIIGCNVSFSSQTSFSLLQLVCEWGGGWSQFRCWFLTFNCLFFDDTGFFGSFFGNFLTLKENKVVKMQHVKRLSLSLKKISWNCRELKFRKFRRKKSIF